MAGTNSGVRVVAISGLLLGAGWLVGRFVGAGVTHTVLMVLATLVAGGPIAVKALKALRFRVVGIELLVTMAAIGATAIGEYWEAAAVTFLFALGGYLEARTLEGTRGAIRKLMSLAPRTARVLRDGQEVEVPADEVAVDEIVAVKPGELIPVDGKVVRGRAAVNQASVTGESLPVERTTGDPVFSGTTNAEGYLEIVATRVGEDTTFARIVHLVEEAQEQKAALQRFLEKFARYYTPGVIALSAGVFAVTGDLRIALTLLVISCPGALVVAAPVAIVAGIGNAARHGVLIKGGEHLERIARISAVALDKTGTLTIAQPRVVAVNTWGRGEDEVLRAAATVEKASEHPIAKAVVAAWRGEARAPGDFEAFPGLGIKASVDGLDTLVGSRRFLTAQGLAVPEVVDLHLAAEEAFGRTVILVAIGGEVAGAISVSDGLREGATGLVAGLRRAGVRRVVMLTGDNRAAAGAVAREVGIREYHAELLPDQKVGMVAELRRQGETVAMVGDGLNDAPALATADVSIAMGAAGSDVAIETADIALMNEDLRRIPYAIGLGKATVEIIKQNTFFAVTIVAALILLVLAGRLELASGMLVHEASVFAVILNALRLLRYGRNAPWAAAGGRLPEGVGGLPAQSPLGGVGT